MTITEWRDRFAHKIKELAKLDAGEAAAFAREVAASEQWAWGSDADTWTAPEQSAIDEFAKMRKQA